MFLVRIAKQWRAALVLLIGPALPAEAHSGDRVFPIAYLTDEALERIQLDDGTVDEWFELFGEPSLTLLDFTDEWKVDQPDPSDFDFRIWLAWHDEPPRIYVALVASDDNYKNTHDYGGNHIKTNLFWGRNDALIFGIDADHSGGAGMPSSGYTLEEWQEELLENSGRTQIYQAVSSTNGPNLDDIDTRALGSGAFSWRTQPPYGDSGGSVAGETPVIWVIELYVTPCDQGGGTWDSAEGSVVSNLATGQVIGFSIGVQDFDPGAEGDFDRTGWVLEPSDSDDGAFDDIEDYVADNFLDGLLLPAGGAEPGDSAVESVSWGRIKASLELK